MVEQQGEEENAPNLLLKLSPELRNHIYYYLLHGIQTSPGVIDYYQITTSERDELADLLSVLRICHQINDELLSFLVKNQTLRIYLRHVPAFVDSTLCNHFFGPKIPIDTSFTVEIVMNSLPQSVTDMDADIAPLLKLVLLRPNVKLIFSGIIPEIDDTESSLLYGRDLGRIFSAPYRNYWNTALGTSVSCVVLHEYCNVPRTMFITLRHGAKEPSKQSLGITKQNLEASPSRNRHWAFVKIVTEMDFPFARSSNAHQMSSLRQYHMRSMCWISLVGSVACLFGIWVLPTAKTYPG